MHLPGTLCFFVILFSLTQVKEASAGCDITSISSPTASSLLVKWTYFPGATNYVLDVRAVNSSNTAPVSIPPLASSTLEKLVQGLRPGQIYQVTFKVFLLSYVTCISSKIAQTIPATSQISFSKAISSTSIRIEWSSAQGADKYFLMVEGTFHNESHNITFTTLNGQVDNLRNNTVYSCYIYSSNAAGIGAKSLVKTIRTLVQPPDGVSVRELTPSMARVSWLSVPSVLLYQVSITASNKPGLSPVLRNVTGTAVNISSLEPCLTYTLGVASINMYLEPGEPRNINYTTPTISTVSSISVEYSCVTAMASVSWAAVFGAMSYRAVITDGQGRSLNCTSTGTACQIPMLNCGELYSVWITAIANCERSSDGSYIFETAPCPPKEPYLYRECSTNVVLFSWSPTNSTAYYHALAIDSDGHVTDCITVGTSCYFTETVCGKSYSFHVSSIYSGGLDCNSGNTEAVVVKTAPCLPENVHTTANCNSISSAVTSWDGPVGAYTYTVEARGNRRDFYNCSSLNTSCTLTDLDCGESLSVWIVATDGDCTTVPVLGEVAETVPCTPQNVSAVETCSSDTASLTWLSSNGAILSIGTATHADGTVHTCTAMATECSFQNLTCGETYDAFVIATNLQCNSSESQHVLLQTAPCAPVSVEVSRDCAGNRATVSWQSLQAGGLYTAVLQGEHGVTVNCSTSFNNCTTADLLCGVTYNVTVSRDDGHCRSQPSTPIQIQSAPCVPQNVSTVLQCDTNAANVTWAASAGANGYTAMATDGQQQRLASCHTMGTSCQLTSLPCGMRLNVTVQADGAPCNSSSRPRTAVVTAPCIPTHVTAALNCTSNIASITWYSALGATWYLVKAEGSQGYKTSCNNTVTRCDIPNLQCGQEYSITVMGMNGDCMGPTSQPITLVSAPCPNSDIQARLDCRTNSALISWTPGNGALSSNATLQSFQDAQKHSCFTNGSSCNISSLQCGQHYNISVIGYGQNCSTCSKPLVTLDTAPCVPTQVNVSLSCGSDTASVSWAASSGLVSYYIVTAEGDNGITQTCNSSSTSCNISGLACGQAYNVSVTAMSVDCTGQRSEVRRVNTAPCVPQNVSANVTCSSNIAKVTWGSSQGAELYSVTASSVNGLSANCTSASSSCDLLTLTCGESYTITVKAKGSNCSSGNSAPVQVQTVPCTPRNVVPTVDCFTAALVVSWTSSVGGQQYTATVQDSNGLSTTCQSTGSQCNVTGLRCGQLYYVNVTASDNLCSSPPSAIVNTNSVPCAASSISAVLDCQLGKATVSWQYGAGAQGYVVSALEPLGNRTCSTSNSSITHCELSNLQCGNEYMVNVQTLGSTCNSSAQMTGSLITGPCSPQHLTAQYSPSTARVSWDVTKGDANFTTMAVTPEGLTVTCATSNTSCTLPDMSCGQVYNISVTTRNSACNVTATYDRIKTEPCPPQNVKASITCATLNATVSWEPSQFAVGYIAFLDGQNGHSTSCRTDRTYCSLPDLTCGTVYNVRVRAIGEVFNSSDSIGVNMTSAPCPPHNISANVQCDSGSVLVSWSPAVDDSQYRVEMKSQSTGVISSCNSTNMQCSIATLPCGESFNISVVALRGSCHSQASSGFNIASAPCTPQGVNGTVDCVTNSAWVSWEVDKGAESYTVLAVGDDGQNTTCSSANSTCNVPDLDCGKSYTFQVTASNAACLSPPSNSFQLDTAPCALSSIVVVAECQSSVIMVQWQRAHRGNSLYIVTAEDQDRAFLSCNSSTSSCNLTNVQCGKEYSIIVAATANQCSSLRSPPYKIRTAPCQPSQVQAYTDCQSKAVFVSWEPSYVAQSYLLTAVSRDGDLKTCNTLYNNCTLTDLHCSNTYNVSVLASNENCTSLPSTNVTFKTVPCEPTNVTANIQCGNSSASLSWVGSTGAVAYVGIAQSENATKVYCHNTVTSCTLMGLVCGTVYNFTVQATDGTCNSSLSKPQIGGAAPCPPAGLRVVPRTVVNDTQILRASWSTVSCPNSEYLFGLKGSIQGNSQALFDLASYWTSRTFFEMPLPCGSSYSATIRARNSAASSTESVAVTGTTVPCAPLNVTFSASSAVVAWQESLFATNYTTYGITSSGRMKLCMTSQLLCSITSFSSGHIVVTAQNAAGQSEDSVPVLVTAVRRR